MKRLIVPLAFVLFILTLFSNLLAQSDYQIVQNFKNRQQKIEQAIKDASSEEQLKSIQPQIDQLKSDFSINKILLDKSLYPDNFDASISKLNNALKVRMGDFSQITTLQIQVSSLKSQVDSLNSQNAQLLSQIEDLKAQHTRDVARLEKMIRELRYSLYKRDKLVMTMLDSLMPPSYYGGTLSSSDKENIYSKAKKNDVISNIKRSINDNIQFLGATTLSPQDLSSITTQEQTFEKMWKNAGSQIIEIYSSKKENTADIQNIDSSFSVWRNSIANNAWNAVRQSFTEHGINLPKFSDGNQFVEAVNSYIDDAIKNINADKDAAKITYGVFVDTVWTNNVKRVWIPYLISNNQFTYSQQNTIESKIIQWKNALAPSGLPWLYIVIIVVLVIIIIILLQSIIFKKNNSKEHQENQS
jgi:hypothetical protein